MDDIIEATATVQPPFETVPDETPVPIDDLLEPPTTLTSEFSISTSVSLALLSIFAVMFLWTLVKRYLSRGKKAVVEYQLDQYQ